MEILSLFHTPTDIKQENNLCPRGKEDVRLYYVYLLSEWHLKQKKSTKCGPCWCERVLCWKRMVCLCLAERRSQSRGLCCVWGCLTWLTAWLSAYLSACTWVNLWETWCAVCAPTGPAHFGWHWIELRSLKKATLVTSSMNSEIVVSRAAMRLQMRPGLAFLLGVVACISAFHLATAIDIPLEGKLQSVLNSLYWTGTWYDSELTFALYVICNGY